MEDVTYMVGPKRWHNSFNASGGLSEEEINFVLTTPILAQLQPSEFSDKLPLRGIIKHDTRIRELENFQVICGKGDYDSSAYIILSGRVGVINEDIKTSEEKSRKKTFLQKLAQLWNKNKYPEVRDLGAQNSPTDLPCIFVDEQIHQNLENPIELDTGELVGEIAALTRNQRTATLYAIGKTTLLEIRWQGLRDLMQRDKGLKEFVLKRYRERSLSVQLKTMPLFQTLSETVIEKIAEATSFAQFGSFDWYTNYKKQLSESPEKRLQQEQVILEQGDYLDGLMIVSAGFCRTTNTIDNHEHTIGYLTKNGLIGLSEIQHGLNNNEPLISQYTIRAVGYVDILTIPTKLVEKYILPLLNNQVENRNEGCADSADLISFLVDQRVINGTQTMVIDLERCVRCDECVKACQSTHDGNSRFHRTPQAQYDRFMIANACMHCTDPVCMIGCPTGAISRNKIGGEVIIDPYLCIGCGTCAVNCPYDNITMVDIRDKQGHPVLDKASGNPVKQATKCDLCSTQGNGPACQRACAHDALKRLDFNSLDAFNAWVAKK